MIDLDENYRLLQSLKSKVDELLKTVDINSLKKEYESLKEKTMEPNFWDNSENSVSVLSKLKNIEKKINKYNHLEAEVNNLIETNEFLKLENDEELSNNLLSETNAISDTISQLEMQSLFKGKYDNNDAIVTIHPGAGGTESHDWAEMLYRMYSRWAFQNDFVLEELDILEGEEAGIKSVTFLVKGEQAYGYLKSEHGVHRLIR